MHILNLAKLSVSELIHKNNYFANDSTMREIKQNGFHVISDFLPTERILKVRDEFDNIYQNHQDLILEASSGHDKRIYAIDKKTNFSLETLTKFSFEINNRFSFSSGNNNFLLAGWIKSVDGEINKGSGDGWHRDSPFSHQFKSILYLNDVNESNGPFQYIAGSHKKNHIRKISKFLSVNCDKYRYSNSEINRLIENKLIDKPVEFCSKAGTLILVDTRGLHRGKPLHSGHRKALTNYFFSSKTNEKNFLFGLK